MLMLTVTPLSGETHRYSARSVSGFHRPLNGEAASLTVTLDRDPDTDADWFAPALGAEATVYLDGDALINGVLARVQLDRTTITVGIEG